MQILIRRTKNNPCLVGDPGVGKTAIAEGLALKIAEDNVPDVIKGKVVYSMEMGSMVAGSKYRGEFEERIKNMPTDELIAAFREKEKGNVSLIRKEMRDRYKAGRDKPLITMAFNSASKSDQSWVKWQMRKERYGKSENHNNQWTKPSWK